MRGRKRKEKLEALRQLLKLKLPGNQIRAFSGEYLKSLLKHLPLELLPEILTATCDIDDYYSFRDEDEKTINILIRQLPSELPHQLLTKCVEVTRKLANPYSRAKALLILKVYLSRELLQNLFVEALATIKESKDSSNQAKALVCLAPSLPPDLLLEALVIASKIKSSYSRPNALIELAPHLPRNLLSEALNIARNRKKPEELLISLAPHLPFELIDEALAIARKIKDPSYHARLLSKLVSNLPSRLFDEALTAARSTKVKAPSICADILIGLSPRLTPEQLVEALKIAKGIKEPYSANQSIKAIVGISPYLTFDMFTQVLTIGRRLGGNYTGEILAGIAPHLPPDLLPEALKIVGETGTYYHYMDSALTTLASRIPIELFPDVLAIVRKMDNSDDKSRTIASLAPNLPYELLDEALAIVREIVEPENQRSINLHAEALTALIPLKPVELLPDALAIVRKMENSYNQSTTIASLAPNLPSNLLIEALSVVQDIREPENRNKALTSIVSHLSLDLLDAALAVTGESYFRTEMLVSLAPKLPPDLLCEALNAVRAIINPYSRAKFLVSLLDSFPSNQHLELVNEALYAAHEIREIERSSEIFLDIIHYLSPDALIETLDIFHQIKMNESNMRPYGFFDFSRKIIKLCFKIATCLPSKDISKALYVASKIEDQFFRANALIHLLSISKHKQESHYYERLISTIVELEIPPTDFTPHAICRKLDRAEMLVYLIPYFPYAERYKALVSSLKLLHQSYEYENIAQIVEFFKNNWTILTPEILRDSLLALIKRMFEPYGGYIADDSAYMLSSLLSNIYYLPDSVKPIPRYADFAFYYDERGALAQKLVKGNVLQAEQWYQLEVAIREKPEGIPTEELERRSIREPKQQKPVTVIVTAEGDGFTISEPVRTLVLPPHGDSSENAYFRVSPLNGNNHLAAIRVRTYYQFNLLEENVIRAEVVGKFDSPNQSLLGLEKPIFFRQERLEQEYIDFDEVEPRAMHVDIRKQDNSFLFNFSFYNDVEQKVEFTAPISLRSTDLEDALLNIRKTWYDIAISKTFTEQLEGDKDEFLENIRRLAKAGRNLWTKLFKLKPGSAVYKIGKWLEEHPLKQGAIVQVSLADNSTEFLFPWALIYDRKVPKNKYELPDPQGFWGLRYCIEQQLPNYLKGTDEPVHIEDKLKLGFMLWEEFRNADQEKLLMERLKAQSSDRLEITNPPITDADDCFDILDECDAHILYFYTHGYTRHRQADIGVGTNLDLFISRYERMREEDPLHEIWKFLYESIKQKKFEVDRSWIELSYGKLFLDELIDEIENELQSNPLVFLNMCESAQVTPSLSDSFISFFIDRGAKGVIGTECPMTVEFAHPFAEKFLEDLLRGEKVGNVLLNARRHFMELKNPLGLAYTLLNLLKKSGGTRRKLMVKSGIEVSSTPRLSLLDC